MKLMERFVELENKKRIPGIKAYLWYLSSFAGNIFFNKPAPDIRLQNGNHLLNLGCGSNHIKDWVNADFYRLHNLFWNRKLLPDWMVDLTKPLNCGNDYWDGVLIEHVNEHLLFSHNLNLFKEVYRILKPGGVCRVIVPDLDRYLRWRELREVEPKMSRYKSLPEAISNLTQNHKHVSVWNFELLSEVLNNVGFTNIERCEFNSALLSEMKVDTESHKWESLYVEAQKKTVTIQPIIKQT